MIFIFKLPIKAMNINNYRAATFRGKGSYKTPAAKEFEKNFNFYLTQYMGEINHFNDIFNEKIHKIKASYVIGIPFIKKDGAIMKRKHDCDNFLKPINDQLFKHLIADDSHITELCAEKVNVSKGEEFIRVRLYISMCQ